MLLFYYLGEGSLSEQSPAPPEVDFWGHGVVIVAVVVSSSSSSNCTYKSKGLHMLNQVTF